MLSIERDRVDLSLFVLAEIQSFDYRVMKMRARAFTLRRKIVHAR